MPWNNLKHWVISLAERRTAPKWLGITAFVENVFFPIPAEILYIPMVAVHPKKAYHYALIATICSVLGGILSWLIGHFAYHSLAEPILAFYNTHESFQALKNRITLDFLVLLLFMSGFSHIPPIKIVTILSGAMGVHLWIFVPVYTLARGIRFYLLAWLIRRFGPQVMRFFSLHSRWLLFIGCLIALGLLVFFAYLYNGTYLKTYF